ncbi:MAG: hypothetical protein WAL61_00245, partial [Acidimicrobiales bacterium]
MTILHAVPPLATENAPPPVRRTPRRIRRYTAEDRFAAVGSFLASFALVYVGYLHILYFSGLLGFLICWYVTFLVVYGVVVSVANPRPIVVERLVTSTLWLAA